MKIDRLYAITIYLLNHGRTSASELSKHFEVSVRTIQRDIDSLCYAGIPIVSISGVAGGYELSEKFKLDKQLTTLDDFSYIITALRGLVSATNDVKAKDTLAKIGAMAKPNETGVILDFSVLKKEDEAVLKTLQTAVLEKHCVSFTYTNNNNEIRTHSVEPIAVIYRWYSWYLLAYSNYKNDYRMYKLVRMSDLKVTNKAFTRNHKSADEIIKEMDSADSYIYTSITVRCKKDVKVRIAEYLNGCIIKEYENGDVCMEFTVVENEHLWFGTLLSLGDRVEIISPEKIRNKVINTASKIISLYNKL